MGIDIAIYDRAVGGWGPKAIATRDVAASKKVLGFWSQA